MNINEFVAKYRGTSTGREEKRVIPKEVEK